MSAFSLDGRHCVVTGGGTGIGRGIALALSAAGAKVAVVGRREAPLQESVAMVQAAGGQASLATMDVTDPESVRSVTDSLAADLGGRIDVLVNNAGIGGPNGCGQEGPDRWSEIVSTNLDGSFYCAREALRHMPDGGRVINISSVLGQFGVPGYTAYCASKHGVIGLTKALALEVAGREITVNAICPGWVDTEMARDGIRKMAGEMGVEFQQAFDQAMGMVPIGRILQPEEIGSMAVYLASREAAGVTAQAFSICGGQVQNG